MIFRYRALGIMIRSITALAFGAVMLFSCKTDIKEVNAINTRAGLPEMSGENMELFYSDSARLKYRVTTPLYNKYNEENKKYDEFPKGIHAELYEKDGTMIGSIISKYAKKLEEEMLWELRDDVVVINDKGEKLETELLYWDMKKEIVYSDRYSRLTADENIIEGNNGFKSDQSLRNPVFNKVTGVIVEKQQP